MRSRFHVLIVSCLLCLFLGNSLAAKNTQMPSPRSTPEQIIDRIIARVNDEIITQSEFDSMLAAAKKQAQMAQAGGMPAVPLAQLKKMVMDQLIAKRIQLQLAKQNKVKISDKQLNEAIANIAKQHKLSVSQLYNRVAAEGNTKTEYRNRIREQLLLMTLQRGVVGNKARVTDADVVAYQEKHGSSLYRVGDIIIPLSANPSSRALQSATKKADAAIRSLRKGTTFAVVAKRYGSTHDGDTDSILDWRTLEQLPTLFAKDLAEMRINQVRGPIRAANGLHVIVLLGKKKSPNSMSAEQVRAMLYQQKFGKIITAWIKKLRASSDVHIYAKQ